MSLFITLPQYGPTVGCNRDSAARRLFGLPHIGERNKRFNVLHIIPTLPEKYRHHAALIVNAARSDSEFYVGGDDMLPTARALEDWLQANPEMSARLHNVRVTFFNALASMKSATLFRDSERLRLLLPLSDHILPYILTGDKRGLPFFGSFARAFALVHQAGPYESELVAPEGLHELMRGAA